MKRRQRSLKQRLARLAKNQQPFNSLVLALIEASTSANSLVESEPEVCHTLPKISTPPLDITLDAQKTPQHFRLQLSMVQRPPSLQLSLSLLQRSASALWVESSLPHCKAAMLWLVPRHNWPLSTVGCRIPLPPERTPRLLVHDGEPALSAASSSSLVTLTLPTASRSIAVEPPAEKRFQKESLLPSFHPGVPAAHQTAAYPQAPAVATKAARSDTVADKPPGAEQWASDDKTEWVDTEDFFKVYRRKVCQSGQASQTFKKNSGFIRKSFHPGKTLPSAGLQQRKKKQPCLSRSTGSILRLRRWPPAGGIDMKRVKILGKKKQLGAIYQRPIRSREGQYGSIESLVANGIVSDRQQFPPATLVAPDQRAGNLRGARQLSSGRRTGEVGHKASLKAKLHPVVALLTDSRSIADKLPGAEPSSSDDGTVEVGREAVLKVQLHYNKVNPKVYRQNQKWEGCKSHRAVPPSLKNSVFISKPCHPAKKRSFQKNFSNLQEKNLPGLGLKFTPKVYHQKCDPEVTGYSDGQFGLSESPTASCTDSHHQPSSPAAAPVYSVTPTIPNPTPEDAFYNDYVVICRLIDCMVMKGYFLAHAEAELGVTMPGLEAMQSYIARYITSNQPPPTP